MSFKYAFCPHDLFINTRADLGACTKLHDEEIRNQFQEAPRSSRKLEIEQEFIRTIRNLINEVERKIIKGRQRLSLMNSKLDVRPMSKQAEAVASINDKITKLLHEAESCGTRGEVEQAKSIMELCDKLKDDKDTLIKQYQECGFNYSDQQEKAMEVCEVCAAFLIVGDAQSRIDDHLMGKQHIGYTRLRKALEDYQKSASEKKDSPHHQAEERRSSGSSNNHSSNRRREDRAKYRYYRNYYLQ